MGDRIINLLIAIILLIIIGLGLLYAYKVLDDKGYEVSIPTIEEIKEGKTIVISQKDNKTNTIITTLEPVATLPPYSSEEQKNINNSSKTILSKENNNKYYYKQLSDYSKIIYDSIANNIDELTKGNHTINIDYNFYDLLTKENGSEMLHKYYDDAVYALNLDIAGLFYIDLSKMSLNIEKTTTMFNVTYRLYIDNGENANYFSESFYSKSQVEEAIEKINNIVDSVTENVSGSKYAKAKSVHDWLIEYLEYSGDSPDKGTIYGACIEKKAVCEGYSRLYKYMLDKLEIENVLVVGTATNSTGSTEDHMWNYLKIDETWYAVDPTWDDPIVYGNGRITEEITHAYFMVGSDKLFQNHVEETVRKETGTKFEVPTLGKNNY